MFGNTKIVIIYDICKSFGDKVDKDDESRVPAGEPSEFLRNVGDVGTSCQSVRVSRAVLPKCQMPSDVNS